jgi:citrate synthase
MNDSRTGLEGIVVADTALSDVDGAVGRLILAGHLVEELVDPPDFEHVAALLWNGVKPGRGDRDCLAQALGVARVGAFQKLNPALLRRRDGMDALRAAVAAIELDASDDDAIAVTAALAVNAAAWMRLVSGQDPIAPDPALGHAADLLAMAGLPAAPERVRAFETYLVTVADHGMNASTFAARVVASTGSDLVSAVTAAIGALKGPLHGGAPGPVLDMLDAIGEPARAEAWLAGELAAGRRIMGMGHRVYRVRDPRAFVLEAALGRLEKSADTGYRLALARAVERRARALLAERHPDRALEANVEFYTAILLDALGLHRAAFTPAFAAGRVLGWCAHFAEQKKTGRLIRPASHYVGPRPS